MIELLSSWLCTAYCMLCFKQYNRSGLESTGPQHALKKELNREINVVTFSGGINYICKERKGRKGVSGKRHFHVAYKIKGYSFEILLKVKLQQQLSVQQSKKQEKPKISCNCKIAVSKKWVRGITFFDGLSLVNKRILNMVKLCTYMCMKHNKEIRKTK